MDIKAEKLELIKWITQMKDEEILSKLMYMKELIDNQFWNISVSEEEKALIFKGLEDIANNRVYSHQEIMEKLDEKYGNLQREED